MLKSREKVECTERGGNPDGIRGLKNNYRVLTRFNIGERQKRGGRKRKKDRDSLRQEQIRFVSSQDCFHFGKHGPTSFSLPSLCFTQSTVTFQNLKIIIYSVYGQI